ncbi:Cro/Cl family transcriptional regulator [Enterococcus villorum]|jgi:DtxR family Mn-dependent transcriptional regulator|uniref:Manganese transport regulator n=2 Tax=Enterococcus villorum TaxID=112904 RepID=A0A1V8YW65_9ENTE|nr:metal-dependent transcriptional regulator [Enterococcus villorum]EOH89287.1 iron dependent repressor, DNA binding protein [Enterococcus villorum ATCC 700913]EOW76095.1 iron dependent repressor, DNA binding protein [Enterococcus villorum ATCC 700913]OQO70965.1 Cro/Cl family transcriptional regulator [Enterococcus villorum]OQO76834.1 Cro/Cl family transcriptional regulator [Enterococcus villorum]GEL91149.1 Cro/Cl family transcriptional regulator [Enterococcus villorum]
MTPNREDYLKIILELGGDTAKVNNKQIVSSLAVSPASVSEMISKLVKEQLVEHSPYQGVQLTDSGLQKASSLIRKHRLWEVFLVEHLNYSWNEVHDDAEVLEHVTSEQLADHLEDYLNHPMHCPHGGIIPQKEQVVHEARRQTLESYPVGTKVRIARVLDEKELLDYLVTIDLNIDEEYEIVDVAAYEGPITIQNAQKKIPVSFKAASTIFVDKL